MFWLKQIAEIKIRSRFCVKEIRMNILRLYRGKSTRVIYLLMETGKGNIFCIICWEKAINHFTIQKSDTVSAAYYYIFHTKRTSFSKIDGLRKRYENDTVYLKFSLRHWLKSISWKEIKNKTFRPWDPVAATLSCARLLLVPAVANGKMEPLRSACKPWP